MGYTYKGTELLSERARGVAGLVDDHAAQLGLTAAERQLCIDAAIEALYRGATADAGVQVGLARANAFDWQHGMFATPGPIAWYDRRAALAVAFAIALVVGLLTAIYSATHPAVTP